MKKIFANSMTLLALILAACGGKGGQNRTLTDRVESGLEKLSETAETYAKYADSDRAATLAALDLLGYGALKPQILGEYIPKITKSQYPLQKNSTAYGLLGIKILALKAGASLKASFNYRITDVELDKCTLRVEHTDFTQDSESGPLSVYYFGDLAAFGPQGPVPGQAFLAYVSYHASTIKVGIALPVFVIDGVENVTAAPLEAVSRQNEQDGPGITIPLGAFQDYGKGIVIKFDSGGKIEQWKTNDSPWNEEAVVTTDFVSGSYKTINDSGLNFLEITWDGGKKEKLLLLSQTSGETKFLLLYDSDAEPYFRNEPLNMTGGGGHLVFSDSNNNWITASSSLKEGKTVFSTDKMGRKIGECWVEGAAGAGIGETLTLDSPMYGRERIIYFSSGFVSYQKPNLYRDNSRIKKVRIYGNAGKSKVVELRDTPHFQAIDIDDITEYGNNTIRMEILEVYPGAKYQDTCVNALCYQT